MVDEEVVSAGGGRLDVGILVYIFGISQLN